MSELRTVWWEHQHCRLIDQTRLPLEMVVLDCTTLEQAATAIRSMQVRGAPAIGVTAAYGMALAAQASSATSASALLDDLTAAKAFLDATRPTAINLAWATNRMYEHAQRLSHLPVETIRERLIAEAELIRDEDEAMCRAIGTHGMALLAQKQNILTHCNAGGLATAAYGTALAPIRSAAAAGQALHVFVDETRPYLQGARLTAWELQQAGIPLTLITDNMAGHFMQRGSIDCIIVGADRVAANGDIANKIGTYSLAVLAQAHNIPFFVAVPTSTIDLNTPDGQAIPIEERTAQEVTHVGGVQIAPEGINVAHPAFDMTPHHLIHAIITEQGVLYPPYADGLREAVATAQAQRDATV